MAFSLVIGTAGAIPAHGQANPNEASARSSTTEPDAAASQAPILPSTEAPAGKTEPVGLRKLERALDQAFQKIVGVIDKLLFFSVLGEKYPLPFVVAFLALGSIFFTFWHGLINVRGLKHSVDVIRGKFDNPDDQGEISHFRALTSALSATVGLGNIAGVAIAVSTGGPGAVFWMMFLAVFGMTAKFHECTLAQMFRKFNPDGSISGGPMYYLDLGLKNMGPGLGVLGKLLAILFAVMCIGGALGGGNMFQANQSFSAFNATFLQDQQLPPEQLDAMSDEQRAELAQRRETRTLRNSAIFGIVMAAMVAIVILGGISRIGAATSRIVPTMCGVYVIASLVIIASNFQKVPEIVGLIIQGAWRPEAAFGGFIGVMVQGFKRAAFSNEAGLGSAAIAHSAAKTSEPVREGLVAMVGPFIDTIVICFMTALVVLITGAYTDASVTGAAMTTKAFASLADWFPAILSICIILFAYSTMISWCYYAERAWIYLLGYKSVTVFRIIFVLFVFFGSIMNLGSVLDFSDLMILCMAFPNILGGLIMAGLVRSKLKDYWSRYTSGQMKPSR